MKTIFQTTMLLVLSYFAVVPPKLSVQMKEVQYSPESIKLENDIKSTIDTIKLKKQRIYRIQEELNIK